MFHSYVAVYQRVYIIQYFMTQLPYCNCNVIQSGNAKAAGLAASFETKWLEHARASQGLPKGNCNSLHRQAWIPKQTESLGN